MVQHSKVAEQKTAAKREQQLDALFGALSDRVRRGVIAQVAAGPVAVSDLADSAGMTLTGMAKHIRVLEDVGLVATEKVGRTRYCRIGTESLDQAMVWIDRYQNLWQRRLDGLEAFFTTPANTATSAATKPTEKLTKKPTNKPTTKLTARGDQR